MYSLWSWGKYMHQYIPLIKIQNIIVNLEISLIPFHLPQHSLKAATVLTFFHHKSVSPALNLQASSVMFYTSILCSFLFQSRIPVYAQSMEFSRPEYWSGQPFPSLRDLANPGIEPRSPALQADSLPSEPPGKPKNTEVGGLSLLRENFLTQESNWGISHCRQILYQLSYQGSPKGRVVSPSGNRTLVSHLTGGDTHHYTKEEGGGLLASTAPNCHQQSLQN